jgi:hypothetical protein
MDFRGQQDCEHLYQIIIVLFAVRATHSGASRCPSQCAALPQIIGFVYGYMKENFGLTVNILLAGVGLATLVRRMLRDLPR